LIQIRNTRQTEYSITQHTLRLNNTMLVFNLIRDHMPISRIELAKRSPFSVSTISSLVDDLLQSHWVVETETVQTSARGRRSTLLEVNTQRGYVATVELLRRGYICTLYDICLKKVAGTRVRDTNYDSSTITNTIRSLMKESHIPSPMLIGIHLVYPGIVDPVSGELGPSVAFTDTDIPDRHMLIRLKKEFREAHVMISTNGTIIAFEEFMQTKDLPQLPLLSMNVDEAIFGGIVVSDHDSNMLFCYPVEVGHMVVDFRGQVCSCGNRGCLETLCRTPTLFQHLNERAGMGLEYSQEFGSDLNTANMSVIAAELKTGNPAVQEVMREYARIFCTAVGSTVNLLGVRSVHVGGDIALLGEPFLQMLRDVFHENFQPLNKSDKVHLELFVNDYEQVRLAATIMCLDAIFRK